ncbi:MAG: ANTAR domain-containing protein [Mycobacterium sp.]
MPASRFQPRPHPQLIALLQRILERAQLDVPEAVGLAVTVHGKRYSHEPMIAASRGAGSDIVGVQLSGLGGPLPDALGHEVPVLSLDLWTDDRWPGLTLDAVSRRAPQDRETWEAVRGAAAVPGLWEDDGNIVISCLLSRPATAADVAQLINYERLVNAAFVANAAESADGIEDMLGVLQSRGAIEQAKGAMMGRIGCDADQAWTVLRRASQDFNVKIRELAVALIEHISAAPAEQPVFGTPIVPDQQSRLAAQKLWAALPGPR